MKVAFVLTCARYARGWRTGTPEQCGSGAVKPTGLADGVGAGCFPQLYGALAGRPSDYVITL